MGRILGRSLFEDNEGIGPTDTQRIYACSPWVAITVPISQAIANIKTVPANGQLVRTARDTGISFGAPDEATYHRRN